MEKKNKVGRPSKYRPEYCQLLIEYMSGKGEDVVKAIVVDKEIVQHKLGELPNFFEGFAAKIDVCVDTLLEWCKEHEEFSVAYKKAKAIQLDRMVKGSIAGTYNSAGAIFALKNLHRWTDKQEVSGPDGGPLQVNFTVEDKDL